MPWRWNEVVNPPPPKEHVYPHAMICSHVVVNVPLSGYTCSRILYPGPKDVPTEYDLERSRRRVRSTRRGTNFVPGYKSGYKCSRVFPSVPQRQCPGQRTTHPVPTRTFSRVPVYTPYPVAKGKYFCGPWFRLPVGLHWQKVGKILFCFSSQELVDRISLDAYLNDFFRTGSDVLEQYTGVAIRAQMASQNEDVILMHAESTINWDARLPEHTKPCRYVDKVVGLCPKHNLPVTVQQVKRLLTEIYHVPLTIQQIGTSFTTLQL